MTSSAGLARVLAKVVRRWSRGVGGLSGGAVGVGGGWVEIYVAVAAIELIIIIVIINAFLMHQITV